MSKYKVYINGVWKDICDCNDFQVLDKDGIWRSVNPSSHDIKFYNGTTWEKIVCCENYNIEVVAEVNGNVTTTVTGGSPNFSYKIVNLDTNTTFIEDVSVSTVFTVPGLLINVNYEIKVTDSNGCSKTVPFKIGQSNFTFLADYIVLSYEFIDGEDLDTRTGIITPNVGQVTSTYRNYLGYDGESQWPTASATPYLIWGEDNQGLGFESVLVDLNQFKLAYPSETEIVIDCRAHWYSTIGNLPVKISAVLYKGTPNCLIKEYPYNVYSGADHNLLLGPYNPTLNNTALYSFRPNIGFSYTTPTITANPPTDSKNVTSVEKVITTYFHDTNGTNPERVCTLSYNLLTGAGVFNI